jgi:hypothetical protein
MTSTHYASDTPQTVRDILESARESGRRLRIFYGDAATGRDWMEESDVIGTIGRSTGAVRVPLMIAGARSLGGPQLLDHCIVRILDVATKRELYRHPRYNLPTLEIDEPATPDYKASVNANGTLHAQFRSAKSAAHYVAFLRGERMCK